MQSFDFLRIQRLDNYRWWKIVLHRFDDIRTASHLSEGEVNRNVVNLEILFLSHHLKSFDIIFLQT